MRVELVQMQYNISDSQALFWCFILIILRMTSLDTTLCSYVLWYSTPIFVLSLFLTFLPKSRLMIFWNCSYKKECKLRHWLLWNTFASFSKWFEISFAVFATRNIKLFFYFSQVLMKWHIFCLFIFSMMS